MALLSITIAVSVLFAVLCWWMAASRGRNPLLWGLLGFCFGPIPAIVLLLNDRGRR